MRRPRLRLLFVLSLAVAGFLGAGIASPPAACAQGTVTPLAGQPKVTAPGGRFGRAAHRRRMHKMRASRHRHLRH